MTFCFYFFYVQVISDEFSVRPVDDGKKHLVPQFYLYESAPTYNGFDLLVSVSILLYLLG